MGQRPPRPWGEVERWTASALVSKRQKDKTLNIENDVPLARKRRERQTDKRQKRCEDSVLGQQKMEVQKDLDTEAIYRNQII